MNAGSAIETLIKMKLYCYEVEQPKRWSIKLENGHFLSRLEITRDLGITSHSISDKRFYVEFTDKHKAELVAELISGEVEEV